MPNDQDLVVLEPFEVVTGRTLIADAMAPAPKVANHILGAQHTHAPLFSVSRPDVWIAFSGLVATRVLAAPVRLATLGDRLTRVRVYLRCSVAGASVTAQIDSIVEGDSNATAIAAAGIAWVDLGTVVVDGDFDDIDLTLTAATASSTISVYGMRIVVDPLASPLPAESVNGASPIGVDRFAADEMYGAAHNRMLRDAASVGYERRRMIWAWVTAYVGGLGEMPEHLHMVPFMPLRGAGEIIRVYVWVDNFGGLTEQVVYPLLSLDPAGLRPSNEWAIVVDADYVGWVTGTMTVPEVEGDGFGTFPVGWVGIQPGDDPFIETTATVRAVAMWAEG